MSNHHKQTTLAQSIRAQAAIIFIVSSLSLMGAANAKTIRIGNQGDGLGTPGCFLHNSRYDFNDEVLPLGAALFAGLVEQSMPLA